MTISLPTAIKKTAVATLIAFATLAAMFGTFASPASAETRVSENLGRQSIAILAADALENGDLFAYNLLRGLTVNPDYSDKPYIPHLGLTAYLLLQAKGEAETCRSLNYAYSWCNNVDFYYQNAYVNFWTYWNFVVMFGGLR